jgi:hypothetical protein
MRSNQFIFSACALILSHMHSHAIDLTELADRYLSDKGVFYYTAPAHFYTKHYQQLFDNCRETIQQVLEIGLNNPGRSDCASLRMWLDYFPNAHIYGMDNQPQTFTHERITIFNGDQRDDAFLTAFAHQFLQFFDLIIDDASHRSKDQAKTLIKLFQAVKPGGVYIIEDMHENEIRVFLRQLQDKQLPVVENIQDIELLDLLQNVESLHMLDSARYGENMFGIIKKKMISGRSE